ncbi:MAG: hypothetical protein AVDCRST_MAG25-3245 [uncultured Rubrobacteraceae bacterium]|uniref:Putative zinc-finger domain-containing protein n=1 Tax=uncultured Rubrobacteraceae bacterium TaxID=349277 RepID=A0A6J4S464_9ACTN|nr:MAG: hypothetical protein AVDCRST_MAG25-3245 [uncultured Rubrobacteraceae bacterium]
MVEVSAEHERFRELLGAHLLGGLDGEEQQAFLPHLNRCPICQAEARELAPVVAALAEAAPYGVEETPEPPADLEERTFARIERERSRDRASARRQGLFRRTALAAAAALIVVAGLVLYPRLFAPEVPIEPVGFSEVAPGVEAEAGLIAHAWGTETRLTASGLRDGQTYRVTLLSEDGTQVPSGAFIGTADKPLECNLNAALLRQNVAGLEVRSANGELMLYAELAEDAPSATGAPL